MNLKINLKKLFLKENFNTLFKKFNLIFINILILSLLTGCLTNNNNNLIHFKNSVKIEKNVNCVKDFSKNVMKITLMKKITVDLGNNRKVSFGRNSYGSVIFLKNYRGNSYFLTSEHLFSKSMNSAKEFYKFIKLRFKSANIEITTRLIISDHNLKQFEAFYVSSNSESDLALIKSSKILNICKIEIFKPVRLERNSEVISAGYAKGVQYKNVVWSWKGLYLGEVMITVVDSTKFILFQKSKKFMSLYSLPSYPGCSGGGIFYEGKLIGVISGMGITVKNSTIATPLKKIKIFLKKYLKM